MSITLPPLPEHLHHPELQKLDAFTREQLRARDQEIVRCVLEAAAKAFEAEVDTWDEMKKRGYSGAIRRKGANAIRALGVRHHE